MPSQVQFESPRMSSTICVGLSVERDAGDVNPSRTKPEFAAARPLALSDSNDETAIPGGFCSRRGVCSRSRGIREASEGNPAGDAGRE